MEKWEYQTRFFEARARERDIRNYIQENFDKKPRRYSPESMIPELNELGEQGWEIIHMEPVAEVGSKEDVRFFGDNWSNVYFCVLKRRKPGSVIPVALVDTTMTDTQHHAPVITAQNTMPESAPQPAANEPTITQPAMTQSGPIPHDNLSEMPTLPDMPRSPQG